MEDKFEDYFNALFMEISNKANEVYGEKSEDSKVVETDKINEICKINKTSKIAVSTIYIGGGTPSLVPEKYIEQLISLLYQKFEISKEAEITIEANPGTINKEKLRKYVGIGINRISIGLQSTNNSLLKLLGRIHKYEDFEATFELARKAGFNNINVDLMIGLPNQTIEDVEDSLDKIISKSPEHISVYSLIVEEGTEMCRLIDENILELPSEDVERKMYWRVRQVLEANGYKHYEISNFAKEGYCSRHNMDCWNQHNYLGFGASAHSYYQDNRYSNITNIKSYIENLENNASIYNIILHEHQLKNDKMKEFMLLRFKKDRRSAN